jgi:23S rRNA (cytosine1962-C5)-methyltransferase
MKRIDITTDGWDDYELIDSGGGRKLERFGGVVLDRPDPQALWHKSMPEKWLDAQAQFLWADKGERWKLADGTPEVWQIARGDMKFELSLKGFKHVGIFPEHAHQWDELISLGKKNEGLKMLNLFGYTGAASVAGALAGMEVTHVDASYPAIGWARENQKLSNLLEKPIRWIEDDAVKFVQREIKRGVKYDGIIMDPPKFGHGPKGERWEFEEMFPNLMKLTTKLLSPNPVFFLVNAYAISASSLMLQNVLADTLTQLSGTISAGELLLQETSSKRVLSTGIYARWEK